MLASGSLGGIFSICLRLKTLDVNAEDGLRFTTIAGASRSIIAIRGALFVHLGMESELFLAPFSATGNAAMPLAMGFLSGFSETFVPNMLRRAESSAKGENRPEGKKEGDRLAPNNTLPV